MKKNLIKLWVFFFCTFLNVNAFSQVTEDNYQSFNWDKKKKTGSSINSGAYFVPGPVTPPCGQGSLRLKIENREARILFRNKNYNETFLKEITELSYWTYITSNQDNNAPYLTIQINKDGIKGKNGYENDFNIVFVPKFQAGPGISLNLWQKWDAYHGDWVLYNTIEKKSWDPKTNLAVTDETTLKDHLFTLEWFIKNNHAIIIDTDPAVGGPGIRLAAGMGGDPGSDLWIGFDGNIDVFKIKKGGQETIYDFEDKLHITDIKRGVCLGHPEIIGSINAVPGTSYSWTSTGGDLPVPENSSYLVVPTTTTATPPSPVTYTLTETAKEGCIYTTNFEVTVYNSGGICSDTIENMWIRFLKRHGIWIITALFLLLGSFWLFRKKRRENIRQ